MSDGGCDTRPNDHIDTAETLQNVPRSDHISVHDQISPSDLNTSQMDNTADNCIEDLILDTLAEQCISCDICKSAILSSDGISINGKYFHRSCLWCGVCSKTFVPEEELFMGADNKLLCSQCKTSNSDKLKREAICFYCKKLISENAMSALDQLWHTECFVCTDCNVVLTGYFRDSNSIPYCENCWLRNFAKKCRVCRDYIADSVMTIEQFHYHIDCVKCAVCKKTFDNVLDILNIDLEFWHVDCFKEDESESTSVCSTSSALLGVYNKSLGFSSQSSPASTMPNSRKISTVSFAQPLVTAPPSLVNGDNKSLQPNSDKDTDHLVERDLKSTNFKSKCCVIS